MFFLSTNPSTQKDKDPNFLNDFKDLHTDVHVVVEHIVITSITSQAPPNPYNAIVVADLLKPIVDYSEVVNIVVEWDTLEARRGQNYPMISMTYTVRQSHFTVAEWFKSHGRPWIYREFHYKNHNDPMLKNFRGSWWREA